MHKGLCSGLLTLAYISGALAAAAEQWRDRAIYQIVTDRFATTDGQPANCNTTERQYCGGTWRGIINRLDYIVQMGFDAVWISPIVANVEGRTPYGEAYHGYWTSDINSLNSHYGTADDLKALSDALHSRSMYLMVDVVVNHFGALGSEASIDYSSYTPFSSEADFHPPCAMTDFNNQTEVELCWIGDDQLRLPDVNTESETVVQTFNDWIGRLVDEYGIDGIRIDTLKHVRADFWPEFARSAGVFTIGEVLSDNVTYTADYTNVVDAVLDYPTWFPLVAAFSSPQGNLSALRDVTTRVQQSYKGGASTAGSFLENHDQPRFQSVTQDQSLVQNALVWTFVSDGIPIIYYGQEQSFTGAHDPDNREALWTSGYQTDNNPLMNIIKVLNSARQALSSHELGYFEIPAQFVDQGNNATLVVSRGNGLLFGLFTNAGSSVGNVTWTIPASVIPTGEGPYVNLLTCDEVDYQSDDSIVVESDSGKPQVLLSATVIGFNGNICGPLQGVPGEDPPNNASSSPLGSIIHQILVAVGGSILVSLLP